MLTLTLNGQEDVQLLLYLPSPILHPQTKHLPVCNK